MLDFLLIIVAILVCQAIHALDNFLSQFGAVFVLHGGLLGYGQTWASKIFLEWCGDSLSWVVVILIATGSLAVAVYKIHNTGTRWIFAFNFGVLAGILYGGFDLV